MLPLSLLSLVSAHSPAVGPPPESSAALVRQLGSENYATRAAAESRLLARGSAAVPAVEAGRAHPDLEVRRRCQEVLRRLRAAACAERVKALRAGRPAPQAPLWGHYRRMLGGGREAAGLFADLYQSESDWLEEVASALARGDRPGAGRLLRAQVRLLAGRYAAEAAGGRREPEGLRGEFAHRLCAALLVAALPGVELGGEGWGELARVLTEAVSFRRAAIAQGGRGEAVRQLIGWGCLGARDQPALLHALRQALLHKLPGPGRALARRALAGEGAVLLGTAAYALGRYGEEADIRRLLPLLANEAEVNLQFHGDSFTSAEVSDFALEALVRLTGQKEDDYAIQPCAFMGIGFIRDDEGKEVAEGFSCPLSVFRLWEDREAAFRRWRGWSDAHHARLGLPKPAKLEPLPFDPWRAHAAARDAALAAVVHGRRLRNWGRLPNDFSSPRALVRARLDDGRVVLTHFVGKDGGPRRGAFWGVRVPGWGRSFLRTSIDESGAATFYLTGMAHDDQAGTVARTTIAQDGGTLTVDFVRRERHETLAVRYVQRAGALLMVKRTRHRDGRVLYAAARSVSEPAELARDHPGDHGLFLSLLKQTNTVEAPSRPGR